MWNLEELGSGFRLVAPNQWEISLEEPGGKTNSVARKDAGFFTMQNSVPSF